MNKKLSALLSEVPPKPDHNPVRKAIETAKDMPDVAAALRLFSSMPPSTAVLANPVRHHHQVDCAGTPIELEIRSFTVRGRLFEEDIVSGKADAVQVIFVGLFGRPPENDEARAFRKVIAGAFEAALDEPLRNAAEFVKQFPSVPPDIVAQHWASVRKASKPVGAINAARPSDALLAEMIEVHMENVAVSAAASYMRSLLAAASRLTAKDLVKRTLKFIHEMDLSDPFRVVFSLLLRRAVNDDEARILGQLGAIQVHHGSAGSNMVARYFAALHTRSISDLFTASQMALDCGRHFGAISDMTDFVRQLERTPKAKRDEAIRARILRGSLPTFGHPEIAAAGRENRLEADPRPALYLAPLFEGIDSGSVTVSAEVAKRAAMVERIYQIALAEGVEKSGSTARLRLTPNTDFGAWLVQEVLGIEEHDRTLLSYSYRGFGWMMDVREQLQQPIIRPVIPPDPRIIPTEEGNAVIPEIISTVHTRLVSGGAFQKKPK
jgi:Citrate synthase.